MNKVSKVILNTLVQSALKLTDNESVYDEDDHGVSFKTILSEQEHNLTDKTIKMLKERIERDENE